MIMFFEAISSERIKCNICANYCKISLNSYGICKQHKNINNQLVDCSYGKISSANPDPIEKKPLYHFLPGSLTYSLGGFGCNMSCLNCQNYIISQNFNNFNSAIKISPETIVENAIINNCKSISWTYNEPTIHLLFNKNTSLLAKKKNLKIIYVSNGYMSNESIEEILKFVDAFNIDLKSISPDFYKKICKADVSVVLKNLKKIYQSGKHLEITNLLINDYNDSVKDITGLVEFIIDELGTNIPLHFSRAFPYYKMNEITPTNEKKLFEAKKIAEDLGMEYVYIGNLPLDTNSYCPECGELLFKRNGFSTQNMNKVKNNKCANCNNDLNFIL